MASRKGYTSLPADSSAEAQTLDAEQPAVGAAPAAAAGSTSAAGAERGSAAARGDATSGRDVKSGGGSKKEPSGAETAGESPGKDADPTGEDLLPPCFVALLPLHSNTGARTDRSGRKGLTSCWGIARLTQGLTPGG